MQRKIQALLLISIIFSCFSLNNADFVEAQEENEINFFYSELCPYCKKEKAFLKDLVEKNPNIVVNQYEISENSENKNLLNDFFDKYEVPMTERKWVPVTFTSIKYFIGFNDEIAKNIEACLKECSTGEKSPPLQIKIPFLGSVDVSSLSLPSLAIVLGALDGFNPCAMWVLLFLITLLISTKSKKRMLLIGGTFILASGIIYFLLLSAWLNFFLAISYVSLTRKLIGIFALAMGIWQIKNFIQYKPGICKVTDGESGIQDKLKSKLKNQAEKIVVSPLTIGILFGIIVLALGVNLVEFFCSAGLPAIFTRVLSLNQLSILEYNFYILIYTIFFMIDDLIIFGLAMFAINKFGFGEKYNYWTTLIGGLLIFGLGILLIFKPELLMFAP